jgi:hypothetical protein
VLYLKESFRRKRSAGKCPARLLIVEAETEKVVIPYLDQSQGTTSRENASEIIYNALNIRNRGLRYET